METEIDSYITLELIRIFLEKYGLPEIAKQELEVILKRAKAEGIQQGINTSSEFNDLYH